MQLNVLTKVSAIKSNFKQKLHSLNRLNGSIKTKTDYNLIDLYHKIGEPAINLPSILGEQFVVFGV